MKSGIADLKKIAARLKANQEQLRPVFPMNLPQGVREIVLGMAMQDNLYAPQMRLVSRAFYHYSEKAFIQEYNKRVAPRFQFVLESGGTNPAVAKQEEEIQYLLENEQSILKKTLQLQIGGNYSSSPRMQKCFARLKTRRLNRPTNYPEFILLEKVLDRLNIEIIKAKIKESQNLHTRHLVNGNNLDCSDQILDCPRIHLTRFPSRIFCFPKYKEYWSRLKTLNLSNNQLKTIPVEISSLTSLEQLKLNGNLLESFPTGIESLARLKQLIMTHNKLTSLPATIGNLKALEWLYIGNNQLKSLPKEIDNLRKITRLVVNNNELTSLSDNLPDKIFWDGEFDFPKNKKQVMATQRTLAAIEDKLAAQTLSGAPRHQMR